MKEAPALRGDVGPEIRFDVASTDSTQIGGDVASDERDFFVVWIEPTDSGNTVYGARVAANGRVLDPEGLPLIEGVSSSLQPAVAFGDGNYLVAAGTPLRDNVTYVRVSTGGDVLDSTPGMVQIDRLTTTSALDAAFDGEAFVLVATQYVVAFELDLYAARIAPSGIVATEPFLVSNAGQGQLHARVAGNGAGTLVVWTDDRNRQEAPYDRAILGKQISEAGEVGAEITIAPFSHFYGAPGVVSLGTDYLVAWGDQRSADPGEGSMRRRSRRAAPWSRSAARRSPRVRATISRRWRPPPTATSSCGGTSTAPSRVGF